MALAVAAAALTLLAVAIVMRLWRADFSVPFHYGGDATQNFALAKGIIDHGWFLTNPSLGTPFGQELYDFPALSSEDLHFLILRVLLLGTSNPALAINVYYIGGFALAAVIAVLVLRALGVSRGPALVAAVLFALLPYHFLRGEYHLVLGVCLSVPLIAYLVVALYGDRELFARRQSPGRRGLGWLSRRTLLTVALCAVVGSDDFDYAGFAVLLALVAGGVSALVRRRSRPLVAGAVVAGLVSATLALNLAPTFLYRLEHGANPAAYHRTAADSEENALRFAQLVLPVDHHRIRPLAELTQRYEAARFPPGFNESQVATLGLVGTLGLLWLLGVALAAVVGLRDRGGRLRLHRHAAAAAVTGIMLAGIDAFSVLIALLVTPDLRSWNRISPLIGFLALLAVALGLDAIRERLAGWRAGTLVWVALLAGTLVVGTLDQTTTHMIPSYARVAASWNSDAAFAHAVEQRLGPGASVYQLPYVLSPESPVKGTDPYDEFRPYMHSRTLRWSFGAMRGRDAAIWQDDTAHKPLGLMLPTLAAAGFQGIAIDRPDYSDGGAAIASELQHALPGSAITSPDGRFAFFDLRQYAARMLNGLSRSERATLRAAAIDSPRESYERGFYDEEFAGSDSWRWGRERAVVKLTNPIRRSRTVDIEATLFIAGPAPGHVTVRFPDGTTTTYTVPASGAALRRTVRLGPSGGKLWFRSDAQPPPTAADGGNDRRFRLEDLTVTDLALAAASRGVMR